MVHKGLRTDRKCSTKESRIKSVSWEDSCKEEYLEENNDEKILQYSLLLAVLPRNGLHPKFVPKSSFDTYLVY